MLTTKQKCPNCGSQLIKTFSRDGLALVVCPHIKPDKVSRECGFQAFLYCTPKAPEKPTTQPQETEAVAIAQH